MVGTYRPVEVHVGLTVKLVVHGEVQAPPRALRLRRELFGLDALGVNWLPGKAKIFKYRPRGKMGKKEEGKEGKLSEFSHRYRG